MNNLGKIILMLVIAVTACKSPTTDIKIIVDANVIKYSALIQVTDAANGTTVPANATITVSGADADNIYEISGKKKFVLSNGVISIGPGPANEPTQSKTVSCVVQVKAPGYNTANQNITFTVDKKQQVVQVFLVKTGTVVTTLPTQPPLPVFETVSLSFTGTCKSRSDIQIRPSIYVFFRLHGSSDAYRYLGYMDKGNITVTALEKGKTYDFQYTFDGKSYTATQLIDQTSYDINVDMGTACNSF
ncbi:MAG TPA: hypothetical protein VIM77_14755 [Mucilaginibacter sp.]